MAGFAAKTIQLSLPFLNKDGVQLKLDAIDLDRLPVRQGRHGIVEGRAPVGADIKMLASEIMGERSFPVMKVKVIKDFGVFRKSLNA